MERWQKIEKFSCINCQIPITITVIEYFKKLEKCCSDKCRKEFEIKGNKKATLAKEFENMEGNYRLNPFIPVRRSNKLNKIQKDYEGKIDINN